MHAGTVNPQAPFSAQRIVAGQDDRRIIANERLHDQLGQKFPKLVNIPNRATEEAMIVREVPVADEVTGSDQIRDITMPHGIESKFCAPDRIFTYTIFPPRKVQNWN